MAYLTGTIDTETKGTCSAALTVGATDTVITLDVSLKTGDHNNSKIVLQHSPDNGTTWLPSNHSTNGYGSITVVAATSQVRACVLYGEGSAASATFFITSK